MPMEKEAFDYIYYGTTCTSDEVKGVLEHVFSVNERLEAKGRRKTPVCIWGRHGIGKTELVEATAKERGCQFVSIAPAQFEEMGDILGMPVVVGQGEATKMAPPEWVPRTKGPGILLIDDVNRADDRILRGLMQLLQNFELTSWKLPPRWQIVLTANPDGGDYSVTPMDDAMLTRMMHVTMRFDVKRWAAWAEKKNIDSRGISFVLTYPEIVTGSRTTPRSLVQFFESISDISDLKKNMDLVAILGESCLDKTTVSAFLSFINQNLEDLISPEEILNATQFEVLSQKLGRLVDQSVKRIDILSTILTRLVNQLVARSEVLTKEELANLSYLLASPILPQDIRLALAQDFVGLPKNLGLQKLLRDPKIASLLLSS
ncbi:MAG: AAA family ATPase [Kofleriaceae bacterium]|nr:AAA family ATPase [Kofleriaceae bacterium]